MRSFPLEFERRKEILFYPARPGRPAGDILEIGPGRGDFLLWVAEHCPDKKIVAVEIDKGRYYRLIPRIERKGLTNILLMQGNARVVLPEIFPAGTFEKCYVLFPDPWPKRRHIPHRLMSVEFVTILARMLRVGGELYCATDFWPYADWVADNAAQIPLLQNLGAPYFSNAADIPHYNPTFYEKKWRGEGRAIYYLRMRRI